MGLTFLQAVMMAFQKQMLYMRHMRFEIVHLTQQKVKGVENTTGMFHQIQMDITLSVITQFEIALLMINPVRYRNTFSKLTCFCKLH